MRGSIRKWGVALFMAASALAGGTAQASPYSNLVIFGDSLSDTGNLFLATSGAQPPAGQPYFAGRFSDGPLWVESLATGLGLTGQASPYLLGGNNYAFAGARTATSQNPPGLLAQVVGIWGAANATADPNALYVVVAGGNDMRDARSAFTGNSAADVAGRQAAAAAAVSNIGTALGYLASKGAQHVLLSNLPDLGATPEAAGLGLVAPSSDVTLRFNSLLAASVAGFEAALGLDIDLLDMAGLAAAVRTDALTNGGAVYGLTNATLPCAGFLGSAGAACKASLFSDGLHPSAAAHALIGAAALVAVPEPGTPVLLALGMFAVWASRRRRAA